VSDLTPAQIENWRNVLFNIVGPVALILSEGEIQRFKENMEERISLFDPPESEVTP